jgi:acyl dehydratase
MPSYQEQRELRYFEDYPPGYRLDGDTVVTVDEAEILEFGRRFDPQPFHVDTEGAATGPFGGLIASGWHTAALMMRLYVEEFLTPVTSLGGPGVDELRWPAPVRPGDSLRLRAEVVDARPSRSKPDRGLIWTRTELVNADNVVVFTAVVINFLLRRTREHHEIR